VYISRDVVFDEHVFPFAKLHPNAGAHLRAELSVLLNALVNPNARFGDAILLNRCDNSPTNDNGASQSTSVDDAGLNGGFVGENLSSFGANLGTHGRHFMCHPRAIGTARGSRSIRWAPVRQGPRHRLRDPCGSCLRVVWCQRPIRWDLLHLLPHHTRLLPRHHSRRQIRAQGGRISYRCRLHHSCSCRPNLCHPDHLRLVLLLLILWRPPPLLLLHG
jgi:hypothetical protein